MQVVEQAATMESLQAQMNQLQARWSEAWEGRNAAEAQIKSVTAQHEELLIKGDDASMAEAEKLEATLKDLTRTFQACELRIKALKPQIADVQQPLLALQQKAAEVERVQKTEELSQEAARLAHNKIALWRQACRAAHAEAVFHAQTVPGAGLLPHEVSQVRQVALDAFDHTGEVVWNEKWTPASASFLAGLTIAPMCPPDSAKDLEVLK
jgi:prefoldin subunit 5